MSRESILRFLSEEPHTTAQIKRRLSASIAKPATESMIQGLRESGLIALQFGRWRLTSTGRAMVPGPHTPVVMRPYVPPVHPRREGSLDFLRCPSVFAGRRVER